MDLRNTLKCLRRNKMGQDIIADALNEIMNAKRSRKKKVVVDRHSKLLIKILDIAKENGYIESYSVQKTKLEINLGKLNNCGAIKPRFNSKRERVMFYVKRFLPARDLGVLIISTNKGLMTHVQAIEKETGGSLIAYFY